MPKHPKPKQQRGNSTSPQGSKPKKRTHYTSEEKQVILAQLAANGFNYSRTAKESGVARSTLLEWQKNPPSTTGSPTEIDALKKEIQESYLEKAKRAREIILDRMIAIAGDEKDLFKLSGAFKTVAEATSAEEVNNAVASRIRGHSAVSESASAQGVDPTGGDRGPAPPFN